MAMPGVSLLHTLIHLRVPCCAGLQVSASSVKRTCVPSRGATDQNSCTVQHETPQQIFYINQTTWREKTFMSSYFQEGDWQVRPLAKFHTDYLAASETIL